MASTAARMLSIVRSSTFSGPPVDASRSAWLGAGDRNQLKGPMERRPLYVQVSVTRPKMSPLT